MPHPGEHHPAFEEYCECIFELHEDDIDVIQARIADRLKVSRPSVSEMIKRLNEEGLITIAGTTIHLTTKGQGLAERVVRRHRLAERFLTDMLGLSWALAHREAGKWEHVMSAEVEDAMAKVLGNPTTCPHGNPIPGSSYTAPATVRMADLSPGQDFVVTRIPEELEFADGMLEFLEDAQLLPGRAGTVREATQRDELIVTVDGRDITVEAFATTRILVTV